MRLQTSVNGAAFVLTKFRWDRDLIGLKNKINTTFTTPEIFIQNGYLVIRVYLNGQRLRLGTTNDYTVAESGGVGTGFNTIIMAIAPRSDDNLTADYVVP